MQHPHPIGTLVHFVFQRTAVYNDTLGMVVGVDESGDDNGYIMYRIKWQKFPENWNNFMKENASHWFYPYEIQPVNK